MRCIYTCQVLRLGREVAGACDDIIDMRVNMSHLHQADLHTGATVTHAIHAPASVYIDHVESTFRHGIARGGRAVHMVSSWGYNCDNKPIIRTWDNGRTLSGVAWIVLCML